MGRVQHQHSVTTSGSPLLTIVSTRPLSFRKQSPPFNNFRVETDIQVDGAGNVHPSERVQPLLLYAA